MFVGVGAKINWSAMKIINLKIIVNTGRFPYLPYVPVSLTNVYI